MELVSKNSIEREMGCLYRSSAAQVTRRVSPVICQMLEEGAEMFGVSAIPEVFLVREYPLMVTITGIERPMLLISTSFLEHVTEEVLWGVMASEMAAVGNGFCQVKLIEWLCKSSVGLLPDTVVQPLLVLFQNWHKYAQYSFDRANLIATQDFNVTMRGVLAGEAPREILDGISFDDPDCAYMKQAREFLKNEGMALEKLRDCKALLGGTDFCASRYLELFQFYQSQYYDLIEEYV